jgi:hypothetical protein
LNSLSGRASLRIPFRLAIAPAQEVRISFESQNNLLRNT